MGINEFHDPRMIQRPGDVANREEKCVCKDRGLEKGDTLYISAD